MATTKGGVIPTQPTGSTALQQNLQALVSSPSIKKRFEDMLGKNSGAFLSSIISLVGQSKALQSCHPQSVMACAAQAASLGFSLNQAIGDCYLVPYGNTATFQMGYKGIIQLFLRSKQAKSCIMTPCLEGEINDWNRFTETFTPGPAVSDKVVGYYASFELTNGFRKATYWTRDEVIKHAKTFSKAYNSKSSPWQNEAMFDAMACKTVLLSIIRVYAPKSIEFQEAIASDGHALDLDDNGDVIDLSFDAVEVVDGGTVNGK